MKIIEKIKSWLIELLGGKIPEIENPQTMLQRLKECMKDNQVVLAQNEQKYRAAENTAQRMEQRLEQIKQDPDLTQGQYDQEQFKLDFAQRSVDKLFRAWKRLSESVRQLEITIEGLEESQESKSMLTSEFAEQIECDLRMKRQELEEISQSVYELDATITEGQMAGSSMRRFNPSSDSTIKQSSRINNIPRQGAEVNAIKAI